jgi:integrase
MKKSRPHKPLGARTIAHHILLAQMIVASAVDEEGNKLYPREWNNEFIGVPPVHKQKQNRPSISSEIMSGLAKYPVILIRVLFILLAASGARIGEMLGIEIDKHISADFRTIKILQKVLHGKVDPRVKTQAGYREVDLHPAVSAILKWFVGERKSGLLFAQVDGKPLYASTLYADHLHSALKALGYQNRFTGNHKAGFNIFRRYRNTYLRNLTPCPEGLRAFWIGHEAGDREEKRSDKKSEKMGANYDMIAESEYRAFRLQKAEEYGIGFDLPSDLASLVPTVPNSDRDIDGSQVTQNEEGDLWI